MKFLKIAGIAAVVVLALAVLGVTMTYAQNPNPTDTPWWIGMRGMMRGNGSWETMRQMHNQMNQNGGMGAMHAWMHQSGGVHDSVWAALSEQLGLTPEELTAEINSGKTLAQVAEEKDVSTQDLAAAMKSAMEAGLQQAVDNGNMTQEQAELMLQNMEGRYEWMITNMGAGLTGPRGGRMGPGPGGCHDDNDVTEDNTSF
jgi:hypothetical protein